MIEVIQAFQGHPLAFVWLILMYGALVVVTVLLAIRANKRKRNED